MIAVASQPDQPVTRFASVVLRGVSWKTYQALVQELENQPNQRLTYNHGQLEIFMPLPPHGSYKRWTGRFVEIITSPSLPRLPLYGAIGVPEVWRFDGETVQLLSLVKGEYQSMPTSIALPMVTPAILETWLTQAQTMGETSWARAICHWIQTLEPRAG